MKRRSATKQALFSSILALLLCVSMLVSSTFAWFTDEVKTGMNTIAAGNLDIALLANGTEVQSGDVLFSKDVNGDDIKLWEPGMVVYENLQIVNKGSLELKYQLFLNFGSENAMKDGGYKLSDVLQVALIDKVAAGTSREAVLAAAEASAKKGALSDFYITGELAADTAATEQAVVIFWKPNSAEIDNLYNVNNGKETTDGNPLHIEFGVTLLATQKMAENDSFGNDYDENAWADAMKVYTANDLQVAIDNGETNIVLMENIEVSEPIVIPAAAATTFSLRSAPAAIVLNLNGKTITAAYDESTQKHVYAFSNYGNVEIVGGTIEARGIYNQAGANMTINGTKVVNLDANGGSCVWDYGGSVVLNNVDFVGYSGCVYATGYLEINGGTYTCYSSITDSGEQLNPTYNIRSKGDLVINGGDFTSRHGLVAVSSGTATINGGTYTMTSLGVITSHVFYLGSNSANLVVNAGTFNCDLVTAQNNGSSQICAEAGAIATVYGGTFNHKSFQNYVAEGFDVTENNGSYSVYLPQTSFNDMVENATAGDTVAVPAGTYTFPASKLEAGVILDCAEGTVFEGTSSLNIQGATVIGATFSNEGGQAVSGTVNGNFVGCTFEGSETLRWCYTTAGTTTVFEDCVINTTLRGIHFDEMNGDVIFRNCEINGFNAYSGSGTITFENCTFGSDASKYNGLNIYSNTVLTDCTFNFTTGKTNFIDMEGTGKTLTITNCTATLDGAAADVAAFVGGSKLAQNTVIIDGVVQ